MRIADWRFEMKNAARVGGVVIVPEQGRPSGDRPRHFNAVVAAGAFDGLANVGGAGFEFLPAPDTVKFERVDARSGSGRGRRFRQCRTVFLFHHGFSDGGRRGFCRGRRGRWWRWWRLRRRCSDCFRRWCRRFGGGFGYSRFGGGFGCSRFGGFHRFGDWSLFGLRRLDGRLALLFNDDFFCHNCFQEVSLQPTKSSLR